MNAQKIKNDLLHFNGTNQYFKNPLFPSINYTDGIVYVRKFCQANWLIIDILVGITELKKPDFLNITLKVNPNGTAQLFFDDGNDNILKIQDYPLTDFPLEKINFFYENDVLYLPSER